MDPITLVAGTGGALLAACAVLAAALVRVRRAAARRAAALEDRIEALNDRLFALAESEERHRSLIDSQDDLIVRRRPDGTIGFANRAYARLLGRPAEALQGTAAVHAVVETANERREADGARSADERLATPEGERWIAWRHHAVPAEEGRGEEIQSVGRDITERKRAEAELALSRARAESASQAKSRFLAVVSHEIRTPLNGIMGMADLLLDTRLTPEQKTYAQAVKSSGEALLALIDEILDFSKIEAGRLDLDAAPFDILPLVEGVAELLAPRAHAKALDLATAVAPDVPARLVGDATRLRQVLLNLAGNAIKFTDAGGVALTVEREGGDIVIRVSDTGPGIADDDLERIFGEFEQGETTLTRRHAGSGLGLAICRRIVAAMGGALGVETERGRGSTFSARLPLAAAPGPAPAAEADMTGLSVLIVSASAVEPDILARRLTARGARVVIAAEPGGIPDGVSFDTVLLDRRIGDEALEAALAALAGRAGRTVLVVTPAARADVAAWRRRGVNGWLVSPVRQTSLAMQLRPAEGRRPAGDPLRDGPPRPAEMPERRLKVLVAEDNEINALLARRLLEKLGHEPIWVRDGRAAVERALDAGDPVDIVLMDMQMPGSDGLSAAKLIRARESGGQRLPIVALTANAFAEDRAAAVAAGMDAFLTKPLDRDRLAEALAAHARLTRTAPAREARRKARPRR